jgi:hypothetical protein
VIAGKRDKRRKDLYELAESLDPLGHIRFTDSVPEEDLLELYYLSYNPDAAMTSKVRNIEGLSEEVVTMGQNPNGGGNATV